MTTHRRGRHRRARASRRRPGCWPTSWPRRPTARLRLPDEQVAGRGRSSCATWRTRSTDNLLTGFPSGALADAIARCVGADALIAVTPVFSASYSGLFKTFFDVLEDGRARGQAGADRARPPAPPGTRWCWSIALRPLFAYLRAVVVPTAVFAATRGLRQRGDAPARCRPGSSAPPASSRTWSGSGGAALRWTRSRTRRRSTSCSTPADRSRLGAGTAEHDHRAVCDGELQPGSRGWSRRRRRTRCRPCRRWCPARRPAVAVHLVGDRERRSARRGVERDQERVVDDAARRAVRLGDRLAVEEDHQRLGVGRGSSPRRSCASPVGVNQTMSPTARRRRVGSPAKNRRRRKTGCSRRSAISRW